MITINKLITKNNFRLLLVVCSILLVFRYTLAINAQPQQFDKRCAVEQSAQLTIPSGLMWGVKGINDARIPTGAKVSTSITKVINNGQESAFNLQVSSDGTAVAYFSGSHFNDLDRTNDISSLKVVRSGGKVLELAANSRWFILGPELSPGHFGVLTYDSQQNTIILDIDYSGDKIVANEVKQLPFRLDLSGGLYYKRVDISPDWQYIAFIDVTISGTSAYYSIFSRADDKVIWRTPLLGGAYPHIFWDGRENHKAIAWVNMIGTDGNGTLTGISPDGEELTKYDLSATLSEDIRMSVSTPQVSSDGLLAIWLQTLVSDRMLDKGLFLLDVNSGKLIDLCISDKTAIGTYLWAEDGKYLLVQRLDGMKVVPLEMMIIDVATGTYSLQYLADDGQALYLVAWSKAQEESPQK